MKNVLIIGLLLVACSCTQRPRPSTVAGRIVANGCDFLLESQSPDGGWHSEMHGLMSSGQATTAFVFFALLSAPDSLCAVPKTVREEAIGFIRSHTGENGALGLADPDVLDFPNYATSYAVMVLRKNGDPADEGLIRRMADYLVSQQFNENRGVTFKHPAYGGWGFGETVFPAGSVGHVDLSHTRRVVQAVRVAGHSNEETYRQATAFLQLHQKVPSDARVQAVLGDSADAAYDGGFFASSAIPVVNKSTLVAIREGTAIFTSYATATADGLLALLAAGHDQTDPHVVDAYRWLESHSQLAYPDGIPVDHPSQWGQVMFFYHLMVRGEVYRAMHTEGPWRNAIADLLADRQRDDGSFSNPNGAPNKEDDPLLATAMVLIALGE